MTTPNAEQTPQNKTEGVSLKMMIEGGVGIPKDAIIEVPKKSGDSILGKFVGIKSGENPDEKVLVLKSIFPEKAQERYRTPSKITIPIDDELKIIINPPHMMG